MTWIKRQISSFAYWWLFKKHTTTFRRFPVEDKYGTTATSTITLSHEYTQHDGNPFFVDEPKPKRKKGKVKQ